jgi:hypothetical protein
LLQPEATRTPLFKEGGEWPERGDGTGEAEPLKCGKVLFDRLWWILQASPVIACRGQHTLDQSQHEFIG